MIQHCSLFKAQANSSKYLNLKSNCKHQSSRPIAKSSKHSFMKLTKQNKESEMRRLREDISDLERQESELKVKYNEEINKEKKFNESLAKLEIYIAEVMHFSDEAFRSQCISSIMHSPCLFFHSLPEVTGHCRPEGQGGGSIHSRSFQFSDRFPERGIFRCFHL